MLHEIVAAGLNGADLAAEVDGPYPAFYVSLQTPARSKSNFRSDDQSWQSLKEFERVVAARYQLARPGGWQRPADKSTPVGQRPRVVAVFWAATTIDAGNLSKSLLDAGKSVLFLDDAEVAADLSLTTRRQTNRWVLAAFAQLPPGAPLRDCAAAAALLSDVVVGLVTEHDPVA